MKILTHNVASAATENFTSKPLSVASFGPISLALVTIFYFGAYLVKQLPLAAVTAFVILISIPVAALLLYESTVQQIHRASMFKLGSRIFFLFSGRFLKALVAGLIAVLLAASAVLQLVTFDPMEWLVIVVVVPAYYLCYRCFHTLYFSELKRGYQVRYWSVRSARTLAMFFAVATYAVIAMNFQEFSKYTTLEDARMAKRVSISLSPGGPLIAEAIQWVTFFDATRESILGRVAEIREDSAWFHAALAVIGRIGLFGYFLLLISVPCVPISDYKRIFMDPIDNERDDAVLPSKVVSVIASLFLVVIVSSFSVSALDARTADSVVYRKSLEYLVGEAFDGITYRSGTISEINSLWATAQVERDIVKSHLDSRISVVFDGMQQHVDEYLDWYYSWKTEYLMLAALVAGNAEELVESEFKKIVFQGDAPAEALMQEIDAAKNSLEIIQNKYASATKNVLERNRLDVDFARFKAARSSSFDKSGKGYFSQHLVAVRDRSVVSASSGVFVGWLGSRVFKEQLSKGGQKFFLKIFKKRAIASGAVRMVCAAGGVLTFGMGVAVSILADRALLLLDEKLHREDMKKDLLASLLNVKEKVRQEILPGW